MAALGKKRAAASQDGPKSKKPHSSRSENDSKEKKTRSRPITAVATPLSEDESESGSDDEEFEALGEAEAAWLDGGDGGNGEDDADVDMDEEKDDGGAGAVPKDPNAVRQARQAQKALQQERRSAKPHSPLIAEAKRIWSLANQKKNIPRAERQKHITDLMNVIRGKVKDIVFKHDASRIIQTVVKYGTQAQRDEIATELKGNYQQLAQSKYSRFLVTKLIRFCSNHRVSILTEFQSHVLRLLLHREASGVLADAFELYTNAYEKSILMRDFYGKEVLLFSDSSNISRETALKGFQGILKSATEDQKKRALKSLKENIITIFNNPDKGAITHAIVHRALWEYLQAINGLGEEEAERSRREMFETCQDVLAEMVHTKDGSRVVREFIAQGTAKDRKHIVKVLKPHVEKMCLDDDAQLVLFSALDIIDDTKLTTKSLVAPVTAVASSLTETVQGRRSLFYLLVPRSRRHFLPAQIETLKETDEIRSRTSKKDEAARAHEVRAAASSDLVEFVHKHGNTLIRDSSRCLVVAEILLEAEGDKTTAMEALLEPVSQTYPSGDSASPHVVDLPHASRLYKNLLQGGHFNHATKAVEISQNFDAGVFARLFVDKVGKEQTVAIAKGNGAFILAELCARLTENDASQGQRNAVKSWFGPNICKEIEKGDAKGKTILLEKISHL